MLVQNSDFVEKPLVTVAIPTYNHAPTLGQAIESALNQTYRDIEVIISDDASVDDTQDVICGFTDPRIRVFTHTKNIGLFENWNACLERARGSYVLILSDDDILGLELIWRSMEITRLEPGLDVVIAQTELLETKGAAIRRYSMPPILATGVYAGTEILMHYLQGRLNIQACGVLMRTEAIRSGGGFPLNHRYAGDIAAFAPLLMRGHAGFVAEPSATYRVHTLSETARLGLDFRLLDVRDVMIIIAAEAKKLLPPAQAICIWRSSRRHMAGLAIARVASYRRENATVVEAVALLWRIRRCFFMCRVDDLFHGVWLRDLARIFLPNVAFRLLVKARQAFAINFRQNLSDS